MTSIRRSRNRSSIMAAQNAARNSGPVRRYAKTFIVDGLADEVLEGLTLPAHRVGERSRHVLDAHEHALDQFVEHRVLVVEASVEGPHRAVGPTDDVGHRDVLEGAFGE